MFIFVMWIVNYLALRTTGIDHFARRNKGRQKDTKYYNLKRMGLKKQNNTLREDQLCQGPQGWILVLQVPLKHQDVTGARTIYPPTPGTVGPKHNAVDPANFFAKASPAKIIPCLLK